MYFSILNEKMSINFIAGILTDYSIPFYIKSDEIFAKHMVSGTKTFENLTDFTVIQFKEWLNH